jgi:hypothetical protein
MLALPSGSRLRSKVLPAVLCGIPAVILALAYVTLALEHGTPLLLHHVVHEDGHRTLLQTLVYPSHFLRELPAAVLTAWAVALAFATGAEAEDTRTRRLALAAGWVATGIAAAALAATVAGDGLGSALLDLAQYRTRDDEVAYGSHWHSHVHGMLALGLLAAGLGAILRGVTGRAAVARPREGWGWSLWLATLVGATVAFRPDLVDWNGTRLLGHGLREIVTHAAITLPLAFAALLVVAGSRSFRIVPRARWRWTSVWRGVFLLAAGAAVPVAVYVQLRGRDVLAAARKPSGVADLLASHAFEHALDYAFVPMLAVALASLVRSARGEPGRAA